MTGWNKDRFTAYLVAMFFAGLLLVAMFTPVVEAEDATLEGFVWDEGSNEPVSNATVTVIHYESFAVVSQNMTDSEGHYTIEGLSDGKYAVTITAQGYLNHTSEIEIKSDTWGDPLHYELDVRLTPELSKEGDNAPEERSLHIYILAGFVIFLVLGAALLMYTKIRRENLLRNAVRKKIFDHIRDNPGMHYRAIQVALDLPMGVFSYHINRLEKECYVKSRQDGIFRRFYVAGRRTEVRFFLSRIQESILSVIRENQGISQSRIAQRINVSRKVVNYHVHILDQAGLIFMENRGRESACYPIFPNLGK